MNKKGQVLITTGIVLALAVVLFVIFGGASLLLLALSVSIFSLIGAAILIFAGIGLINGVTAPPFVWAIGVGLVVLPMFFNALNNMSLATILP